MPHQVERYEGGDETADDRERRQREREADHPERRHRYHHSERDEEQRDEEVAQPGHLRGDVEGVGEGRQRDARHHVHLARQIEQDRDLNDQASAPTTTSSAVAATRWKVRQHEPAEQQRGRQQRGQPATERRLTGCRLPGSGASMTDVLQHQDAE